MLYSREIVKKAFHTLKRKEAFKLFAREDGECHCEDFEENAWGYFLQAFIYGII